MSKEALTLKETMQLRGRTGRVDLFLNEYDVAVADGYKRDRVRVAGTMIICDMYRERSEGVSVAETSSIKGVAVDEIIVDELKEASTAEQQVEQQQVVEQQVAEETPKTTTRKTSSKK